MHLYHSLLSHEGVLRIEYLVVFLYKFFVISLGYAKDDIEESTDEMISNLRVREAGVGITLKHDFFKMME